MGRIDKEERLEMSGRESQRNIHKLINEIIENQFMKMLSEICTEIGEAEDRLDRQMDDVEDRITTELEILEESVEEDLYTEIQNIEKRLNKELHNVEEKHRRELAAMEDRLVSMMKLLLQNNVRLVNDYIIPHARGSRQEMKNITIESK